MVVVERRKEDATSSLCCHLAVSKVSSGSKAPDIVQHEQTVYWISGAQVTPPSSCQLMCLLDFWGSSHDSPVASPDPVGASSTAPWVLTSSTASTACSVSLSGEHLTIVEAWARPWEYPSEPQADRTDHPLFRRSHAVKQC